MKVTVNVDTAAFAAAVGQNAAVNVTVGCLLDLEDLAVPGVPGKRTVKREQAALSTRGGSAHDPQMSTAPSRCGWSPRASR